MIVYLFLFYFINNVCHDNIEHFVFSDCNVGLNVCIVVSCLGICPFYVASGAAVIHTHFRLDLTIKYYRSVTIFNHDDKGTFKTNQV